MIRAYYFHQKATDVIKEELKKNFCSLSVEYGRTSTTMTPGTKGGISYMVAVDKDKLSIIITCRNPREVIGEKGSRLRLLTHKINGCFGFNEDFVQLYVQKHGPLYDVEDVDDKGASRKGKGKGRKGKGYVMDDGEEEEPSVQAKVNVKAKPPQRHEVPDFDSEQWKECARRCAKLGEALKDEKTFAPINMILRDPLRYGLRLWREYNLRARPMEFREIEPPLDLCETQDIGDEYIDEWSVGMDPSDGWSSPPQDLDWSAAVDLTEEQKKAARAKRFGTSKASDSLVLKDFGSDEEILIDNVDLGSACCADVIERLKDYRLFASNVEPVLVLLPSAKQLEPDFPMSKLPAGETLNFMALTRKFTW